MTSSNAQLVSLADVASFSSGRTPSRSRQSEYFDGGNIPWVKTLDLNNGAINATDESVTSRALVETGMTVLPPGTVLVAMYGGFNQIGRTGVLRVNAATNQAITAVLPHPQKLDSDYLLHLLNYKVGYWRTVASSSRKDPNITKDDVRQFRMYLPTVSVQRQVAESLNDAGSVIATLERLIAKKQAIKQGMMQQLLTGHTRLPGFGADWVTRPLKEVAPLQRGFDLPATLLNPGPHPVVYSNGVSRYHSQAMAQGPGVVTGRSGTIGKVHYVQTDYWPHNTTLWVTDFSRATPLFVFYLLKYIGLERFASGSGVPTFNRNDAHAWPVTIPEDLGEQDAISSVLSDADAELYGLQRRLTKARNIKTGMMQQLLTGRTRLPLEGVS